jgi:hypothetical protein
MTDDRKLSTSDIAAANERDTTPDRPAARRIALDREPCVAQADAPPPRVDGAIARFSSDCSASD